METLVPLLIDNRIDEIILCDDCSQPDDYNKLVENCKGLPKIRIIKNVENWHNQHNKRNALSFAKNEWVLLLDNDNIAGKDFIDAFYGYQPISNYIFHPSFASPNFDYRIFNARIINRHNVSEFMDENIFIVLCNTNNYFVNRDEYLRVYQYDKSVRGADGVYFLLNWLKVGNSVYIMPDSKYFHRVHSGSEFLREQGTNMKLIYHWFNKLREL